MALNYDYGPITHPFSEGDVGKEIVIHNDIDAGSLTPNVSVNNVDYYIKSIRFWKSDVNAYFIIQNETAPINGSQKLYIVIPLNNAKGKPEITSLYTSARDGNKPISFTLNNIISDSIAAAAPKSDITGQTMSVVMSPVNLQFDLGKLNSDMFDAKMKTTASSNMIMQNLNLNWYVECKHEGDDQETQEPDKANAMDNLMLVIIILLVCSVTYLGVPTLYAIVLKGIKQNPENQYPLKFIDTYWMIFGVVSIIVMMAYGIGSKNNIFYFLAILIFLIYLSAKMSINQLIGSVYGGKDIEKVAAPFDKLASTEPVGTDSSEKSMPKIKVRHIGWFDDIPALVMYVFSIVTMFLSLTGLTYRNHDNKTGSYSEEEGKKQADTLFAVLFIAAHFGALIALYAYVADKPKVMIVGIVYFLMSIVPMIVTISVIAAQMND